MIFITTDPGQVKVGEKILPGVFESLEITASVQTDEAEIKGKKNRVTQAVGYTNAQVRLTLVLIPKNDDDDCSGQVRTIQEIFRKSPSQEVPGIYKIVNKHTQARGITEVIFTELRTYEDNKNEKIIASLSFVEHVPVNVKIATSSGSGGSKSGNNAKGKESKGKGGSAAKGSGSSRSWNSGKKTDKTPAKDKIEPSFGKKLLNWLRGKDIG